MMIWSTKSQHIHNTSKCAEFDGWFEFSRKRSSNAQKRAFYRSNWRVGGLFYLTFSLNSSKTIIFDIFLDLPLLNDKYEYVFWRGKGIGANGPPLCARSSDMACEDRFLQNFMKFWWKFVAFLFKKSVFGMIVHRICTIIQAVS